MFDQRIFLPHCDPTSILERERRYKRTGETIWRLFSFFFFLHIYFKSIDFPQLFPVVMCALLGYLIEWNPKHENRKVFIPNGNKTYFQVMWDGKKTTKTVKILIIIYEIYPLGRRWKVIKLQDRVRQYTHSDGNTFLPFIFILPTRKTGKWKSKEIK
jgi:hypothetical protein